MENIEQKIFEAVEDLKKDKINIAELEDQMSKLQEKINFKRQEMEKFEDRESAFYKDLEKEAQEADHEFRIVFAEREKRRKELIIKLQDNKENIISDLRAKIDIIEQNRDKELGNLEELKEEKAKIEKELKLNDITKEEFEKLSPEEKKEVKTAKERYLINKKRFGEVSKEVEILEILDGKTPKDKYLEIYDNIKNIEENFNIDNFESLANIKVEEKNEKQEEIELVVENSKEIKENNSVVDNEVIKEELKSVINNDIDKEEPVENNMGNNYMEQDIQVIVNNNQRQVDTKIKNIESISILESKDKVVWGYETGEKCEGKISDIKKQKRKLFKRNNIKKICKELCRENNEFLEDGDFIMAGIEARILAREVNPVVLAVLNGNQESIKDYIRNIYSKENFSFELVHDISKMNILEKIRINKYIKSEEKCGAKILGKMFNKNKALNEPIGKNISNSKAREDFIRTIEYINKDREEVGREKIESTKQINNSKDNRDDIQEER